MKRAGNWDKRESKSPLATVCTGKWPHIKYTGNFMSNCLPIRRTVLTPDPVATELQELKDLMGG